MGTTMLVGKRDILKNLKEAEWVKNHVCSSLCYRFGILEKRSAYGIDFNEGEIREIEFFDEKGLILWKYE
jgi:hypothetical protein